MSQTQRVLFLPEEAIGQLYRVFELVVAEDDDAFDLDAKGEVQWIGHVLWILAGGMYIRKEN